MKNKDKWLERRIEQIKQFERLVRDTGFGQGGQEEHLAMVRFHDFLHIGLGERVYREAERRETKQEIKRVKRERALRELRSIEDEGKNDAAV